VAVFGDLWELVGPDVKLEVVVWIEKTFPRFLVADLNFSSKFLPKKLVNFVRTGASGLTGTYIRGSSSSLKLNKLRLIKAALHDGRTLMSIATTAASQHLPTPPTPFPLTNLRRVHHWQ